MEVCFILFVFSEVSAPEGEIPAAATRAKAEPAAGTAAGPNFCRALRVHVKLERFRNMPEKNFHVPTGHLYC